MRAAGRERDRGKRRSRTPASVGVWTNTGDGCGHQSFKTINRYIENAIRQNSFGNLLAIFSNLIWLGLSNKNWHCLWTIPWHSFQMKWGFECKNLNARDFPKIKLLKKIGEFPDLVARLIILIDWNAIGADASGWPDKTRKVSLSLSCSKTPQWWRQPNERGKTIWIFAEQKEKDDNKQQQ